jgi:hypothetical protein
MRDEVKYVNHKGQTINLNGEGIFSNYKEAFSYKYKINNGKSIITEKSFELLVIAMGGSSVINNIIDILVADTIDNQYGKLYINGWYIRCKHIGLPDIVAYDSEKIKFSLSFYAPSFEFTKGRLITLSEEITSTEEFLDFPFGFDFDMSGMNVVKSTFINEQAFPADFILKFNAQSDSVDILIGDNSYIVNESVNANETFVINTEENQVYKEGDYGRINLFDKTSDSYDIFAKIPSEEQTTSWVGNFSISLLLIEHRSVPLWN